MISLRNDDGSLPSEGAPFSIFALRFSFRMGNSLWYFLLCSQSFVDKVVSGAVLCQDPAKASFFFHKATYSVQHIAHITEDWAFFMVSLNLQTVWFLIWQPISQYYNQHIQYPLCTSDLLRRIAPFYHLDTATCRVFTTISPCDLSSRGHLGRVEIPRI